MKPSFLFTTGVLFASTSSPLVSAANTPVVIVPGTGGNRLQAKLSKAKSSPHFYCSKNNDWEDIWLSVSQLLPGVIDCWCENIQLVYDSAADELHNIDGVETRVPCFGDTCGIEYLDTDIKLSDSAYFADVVEAFVKEGYVRGVDIVSAPTDWRYAANSNHDDYLNKTISLIEDTYTKNEDTPVVLIGHSMGSLWTSHILRELVNDEWKSKYIQTYVPISPVFGGSVNEYKLYATGQADTLPGISSATVKDEQRSYESNIWLLPSAELWTDGEATVKTPSKSYGPHNIDEFFTDVGYPLGSTILNRVKPILSLADPKVADIRILYGTGVDTDEFYEYTKDGSWDEDDLKITKGNGDGTVNIRSLESGNEWENVQTKVFDKQTHSGILKDQSLIDYLVALTKH